MRTHLRMLAYEHRFMEGCEHEHDSPAVLFASRRHVRPRYMYAAGCNLSRRRFVVVIGETVLPLVCNGGLRQRKLTDRQLGLFWDTTAASVSHQVPSAYVSSVASPSLMEICLAASDVSREFCRHLYPVRSKPHRQSFPLERPLRCIA